MAEVKVTVSLKRTDTNFKVTARTISVHGATLKLSRKTTGTAWVEENSDTSLAWTIDGDPGTPYEVTLSVEPPHTLITDWPPEPPKRQPRVRRTKDLKIADNKTHSAGTRHFKVV